jgi:RNA polymerase sigma factor (sigma-70 family)
MFHQTSDARIIQRVLSGHTDDFGILVDKYMTTVCATVRSRLLKPGDTSDVVQESFVRAYQKLATLEQHNRFASWLLTIARNTALNWRRKQKPETPLAGRDNTLEAAESPDMESRDQARVLFHTLQQLPEDEREILLLHYYAGKSLREIAVLMDISRDAAAKRLQRARDSLGEELLKGLKAEDIAALREGRKKILRACLAAPVAWQPGAAAATAASGAGLAAKLAAAGTAAFIVAGTGVTTLLINRPAPEAPPPLATPEPAAAQQPATSEAVPESSGAEEAAAAPFWTRSAPLEETGPCGITVLVEDASGNPVAGATVMIEKVTWEIHEMPPEKTLWKEAVTDEKGTARFTGLPHAIYALACHAGATGGAFFADLKGKTRYRWKPVLFPLTTFSGTLETASGAPVAGAVLYPIEHMLYRGLKLPVAASAPARTLTGPDGRFSFPRIFPGSWRYYALAPDGRQFITDFQPVVKRNAVLTFPEGGALRGRLIHHENRRPVPGTTLRFTRGSFIAYAATTDANGHFQVSGMSPGKYYPKLEKAALALESFPDIRIEDGETRDELTMTVLPAGIITGRVVHRESGRAIPGVLVVASCPEKKAGRRLEQKTGIDGGFIFSSLGPGDWNLRCQKADMQDTAFGWNGSREVRLEAGETLEDIEIPWQSGFSVSGWVRDTAGEAIAGARVKLSCMEKEEEAFSEGFPESRTTVTLKSDARGGFRFTTTPRTSRIDIHAEAEDSISPVISREVDSPELTGLILTPDLPAAGWLSGTVYDAGKQPLTKGRLWMKLLHEEYDQEKSCRIDETGGYYFDQLAAGNFEIKVDSGNAFGNTFIAGTLRLNPGQRIENHAIYCGGGNMEISGRVTGPDGHPVPEAGIWLEEKSMPYKPGQLHTRTGADGRFTIACDAEKTCMVIADKEGLSPSFVQEIAAGSRRIHLRLGKPAALQGTIRDAENGRPVRNCRIRWHITKPVSLMMKYLPLDEIHAPEGRFSLDTLPVHPLAVKIEAEGYETVNVKVDDLEEGKTLYRDFLLTPH